MHPRFPLPPLILAALALLDAPLAAAPPEVAPLSQSRALELSFNNGLSRLAGTLSLPSRCPVKGCPAILIVAGSGPADRSGYGVVPPLRDAFLAAGFAVLAWDRPGTGTSTGSWQSQSIDDRVDEVIAAVDLLAGRSKVDGQRIGLWGISQAGWVIPAAARKDRRINFLISVSGPGSTGAEQDVYRIEHSMQADGRSAAEIAAALQFSRQRLALMKAGAGFAAVEQLQARAAGQSWAGDVGIYTAADWERLKRSQRDPRQDLEHLQIPILAVYGERDTIVDWRESANVYAAAAAKAGNKRLTIVTFPAADHVIFPSVNGSQRQLDATFSNPVKLFAPGYLETMTAWLRAVNNGPAD